MCIIFTLAVFVLGALKAERAVEIYSVENLCGSTGIRGKVMRPQVPCVTPKRVQRVGFVELDKNLVPLPASSTKRGRGVVLEAPRLD
jgi:hypothetical protein